MQSMKVAPRPCRTLSIPCPEWSVADRPRCASQHVVGGRERPVLRLVRGDQQVLVEVGRREDPLDAGLTQRREPGGGGGGEDPRTSAGSARAAAARVRSPIAHRTGSCLLMYILMYA